MIIITGNIDISVGAAIGVLVSLSGTVAVGLEDLGVPVTDSLVGAVRIASRVGR